MAPTLEATRSEIRSDFKRYLDAIEAGATVAVLGSNLVLGDVSPAAERQRREREALQQQFLDAAGTFESVDGKPLDIDGILASKGL